MEKVRCMGCMEEYDGEFEICPYCGYIRGTEAREAYHIAPGSRIHRRYIIGRVLGFGGFGITYLGYDTDLEMKVAIKEYMPSEFSTRRPTETKVTVYTGEKEEQFQAGLTNLINEGKRLAKFQQEPDIVHIFDCFQENNTAYIVMEYLEGETLKERIEKEGRLPLETALPIILTVLRALEKVHEEGIIHRDIAPDNIYLLKDGGVKICDFGSSRYATTKYSKSLSVMIKPGYAPEEQYCSRGDQGPWTDVYAAAATFYKMLTGVTPEDAMERKAKDTLKKPSKMGVKIPKNIETAIMNALNVKICDRTQSAAEFAKELHAENVIERQATEDKPEIPKIPWWVIAIAGTLGAAIIAVIVLLTTGVISLDVSFLDMESRIEKNQVRTPNLLNEYVEDAQKKCDDIGLQMRVAENKKYDDVIPADKILEQSPAIREMQIMETGSEIVVTICGGVETVTVPKVVDKNWEDAVKELEKAGFTVALKEEASQKAPGTVVSQSQEAETKIKKGSEILLVISLGEEGRDSSVETEMPDVVGMAYQEAEELLGERSLYLEMEEVYSDTIPEGIIISQEEEAGAVLYEGDSVKVVVSAGKEMVEIPDVETKMLEDAIEELEALGLEWSTVEEYNSSYAAGQVISQDLKSTVGGKAHMVEKGTEVVLTVSKGRAPASTQSRQQTPAATRQTRPAETPAPQTRPAETPAPQTRPAETPAPQTQPAETPAPQTQPAETPAPQTQPAETPASETVNAPYGGQGAGIQDFIMNNGNVGAN